MTRYARGRSSLGNARSMKVYAWRKMTVGAFGRDRIAIGGGLLSEYTRTESTATPGTKIESRVVEYNVDIPYHALYQ
jgi:hypothetical protein